MTFSLDPTREARVLSADREVFDIVIVGGGIVGAALARDIALRGYTILLLEAVDYGHGTSSRSSKMLHGGVRYLEQGDVALVHEALREREILLRTASHLNRVQETLFPVMEDLTRPGWQIDIGLRLYDFLANPFGLRRSAFGRSKKLAHDSAICGALRDYGLDFQGMFAYSDGQMNDLRLVIENIVDAAQNGAITLNHARVIGIRRLRGGNLPAPRRIDPSPMWEIEWRDGIANEHHRSRARFVVNAAGPWTDEITSILSSAVPTTLPVIHSRGTHLLFDCELPLPSIILPTGVPGRYYFVHPFFSPYRRGTLVGPTHGAPSANEEDPQPSDDELAELFGYLQRDLPGCGLSITKLYRAFCGMRTLVPSRAPHGTGTVSDVSRRDRIVPADGYLAVLGGKYTTARMTAETVAGKIDRYFGLGSPKAWGDFSTRSRFLPGGMDWTTAKEDETIAALTALITAREDHWVPDGLESVSPFPADVARTIASAAVRRLGAESVKLLEDGGRCVLLSFEHNCLELEVIRAFEVEQSATLDDVLVRRLELGSIPGSISACRQSLFQWFAEYCTRSTLVSA